MLKERRQLFSGLFVAADLLVLGVAFVVAYALRFYVPLVPVTKGVPPVENYVALLRGRGEGSSELQLPHPPPAPPPDDIDAN